MLVRMARPQSNIDPASNQRYGQESQLAVANIPKLPRCLPPLRDRPTSWQLSPVSHPPLWLWLLERSCRLRLAVMLVGPRAWNPGAAATRDKNATYVAHRQRGIPAEILSSPNRQHRWSVNWTARDARDITNEPCADRRGRGGGLRRNSQIVLNPFSGGVPEEIPNTVFPSARAARRVRLSQGRRSSRLQFDYPRVGGARLATPFFPERLYGVGFGQGRVGRRFLEAPTDVLFSSWSELSLSLSLFPLLRSPGRVFLQCHPQLRLPSQK